MADNNLVSILIKAKSDMATELGKSEGALASLQTKLSGLSSGFALAGGVMTAAVVGLAAITKRAADTGDALLKASDQTGITVEALSALNYAGVQSDITLQDLAQSVKFMSVNMAEAIQKAGEGRDVFTQGLGISLKQLNDVSGDSAKAFELIATQLASVTNATHRANLQTKIFGRSSQELTQFIDDLAQRKLKGFQEAAEKAGVVIGRDFALAADAFNDNLAKMGVILDALLVKVGGPIIGALTDLAQAIGLVGTTAKQASLNALDVSLGKLAARQQELQQNISKGGGSFIDKALGAVFGGMTPEQLQVELASTTASYEALQKVQQQLMTPAPSGPGRTGALPSEDGKNAAKKMQEAVASLTKSLQDQRIALEGQRIEMEQGEGAALRFAIAQKIAQLPGKPSAEQQSVFDALAVKIEEASNQLITFKENAERAKAAFEAIDQRDPFEAVDMTTQAFQDEVAKMVMVHREAQNSIASMNNQIADVFMTNSEREKASAQQWGDSMIFQLQKIKEQYKNDIPGITGMVDQLMEKIPTAVAEKLNTTRETIRDVLGGITDGFSTMIRGVVQGTQTIEQAFANMAQNIALSIADKLMQKALDPVLDKLALILSKLLEIGLNALAGSYGGVNASPYLMAAQGGIFRGGLTPIRGYAGGGVVRSPQMAFIGEGGQDEAVIPLRGGKVPVQMQGQSSPNVSVHIHGDVAPHPGFTKDNVIDIVINDYRSDGRTRRAMRG